MARDKIIFIVAPSGAAGGGMGRVKDYILESGRDAGGDCRFVALVTRDGRGALFSLVLLAAAVLRIWWAALCGRLGFVHVNFGDKGSALRKGIIVLGARLAGGRTLLHLHAAELTGLYQRSNRMVRFLLRQPFHAATSIAVLGRLWRDWLVDELQIEAGKIDVLYNGVPIAAAARDFVSRPNPTPKILFLGLLTERKGISDFIYALSLLPKHRPGWQAVIAGNGNIRHYEALAHALGIGERVTFTGWIGQADVRALLGSVDLMVLPSYNEGLPLVILEALGAGTPVICTPIGAIPEVLEDGRSVLFVPPGDRDALAATMVRVLGDPALRQRLSGAGQATFMACFTLDAFLDALFAIYRARFGVDFSAKRPDALAERAL